MPVIEPINDDYLASFGRSYADSKNSAARASSQKKKMEENSCRGRDRVGAGGTPPHDSDDGSSSSSSDSGDSSDDEPGRANGVAANDRRNEDDNNGGGAVPEDDGFGTLSSSTIAAVDGFATPARKTTGASLSARQKKHGVFVVNLPFNLCDERKLEAVFSGFGRINAVVLTKAPEGKR